MMMQIAGERLVLEPIIYMADIENPTSSTLAAWKEAREQAIFRQCLKMRKSLYPTFHQRRRLISVAWKAC